MEWGSRAKPFNDSGIRADFAVLVDPDAEAIRLAEDLCPDRDRFLVLLGPGYRQALGPLGLRAGVASILEREVDLTPTSYLSELISESHIGDLNPLRAAISLELPDAAIPLLVSHSIRTETGTYPVLSLIREPEREIVLGTGLGFWELGLYSPEAHATIFGGLVSYFMRQHNEFFCETDKKVYFAGEPVSIHARAYDESGDPLEDVFVQVIMDVDTVPLRYRGPGRFESAPLFFTEGDQQIDVLFLRSGERLARRSVEFRVREGNLEATETGSDTVLLGEIARAGSGAVLERVQDLSEVQILQREESFALKPNVVLPFLLLFLGVLSLEGWIRKRRGLL
jgi:hypothetical protein